MSGLVTRTAAQLAAAMQAGDVSAVEVVQAHLDRIAATDDRSGAWLAMTGEQALADAADVDARRSRGDRLGPRDGHALPRRRGPRGVRLQRATIRAWPGRRDPR